MSCRPLLPLIEAFEGPSVLLQFRVSRDAKHNFRRSTIAVDEAVATKNPAEQRPSDVHSFDEALAASNLLQQPVAPGETGNHFYTTQPFQLLSWYPR